MGIKDASKLEEWLAEMFPTAFYFRLPDNFSGSLVVQDLSAILTSCFLNESVVTADDMVDRALVTALNFIQAPEGTKPFEGVEERASLVGSVCDENVGGSFAFSKMMRYLKENDQGRGNYQRRCNYYRDNWPELFLHDATIVLAIDDQRYTPSIRKMLHESRYRAVKSFEEEELKDGKWRVFGDYPLVGDYPLPEKGSPTRPQRDLRQRAQATPCFRRALTTYIPWRMAMTILKYELCANCQPELYQSMKRLDSTREAHEILKLYQKCKDDGNVKRAGQHAEAARAAFMGDGSHRESRADATDRGATGCTCLRSRHSQTGTQGRKVVIDQVTKRFDIDEYASRTVDNISEKFYNDARNSARVFEFDVGKQMPKWLETPAIGESDLKMVYYILTHSKPGDDVLVRNSDSDVLYILLMNMHRFVDPEKKTMTRRIFLDQNHPRLSEGRLKRRFVCLNELYERMAKHGQTHWDLREQHSAPIHMTTASIFTSFALLLGSDYTERIERVGPTRLIKVLNDLNFMKMVTRHFQSIILYSLCEECMPPGALSEKGGARSTMTNLFFASVSSDFARIFTLECIIRSTSASVDRIMKTMEPRKRYSWKDVKSAIDDVEKSKNVEKRYSMMEMDEIVSMWSRISWTLTYMGNAPLSIGAFPSPVAISDEGFSMWGWNLAKRRDTCGLGLARRIMSKPWRKIMENRDGDPPDMDDYVPAKDFCVMTNHWHIFSAVLAEVFAKLYYGRSSFSLERKPHWALSQTCNSSSTSVSSS